MEMEDRVIYSSFNHYSIAKILELDPKASTGILYADIIYDVVNYDEKIGTGALHPATFHVQMADFLQRYVESDLAVHVWTVNDKAEIERLMEAGVDAVITNYPDVAVSCRNAKVIPIGEKACSFWISNGTICVGNRLIPGVQTGF